MERIGKFLLLLWFFQPAIAIAGDYLIGNFEFDIPGSWQVKTTNTGLIATQGDSTLTPNTLLKIEHCVSTESSPCKAEMLFLPAGSNPENYYFGKTSPTTTPQKKGLNEIQKICSIETLRSATQVGMLYLSSRQGSQGLILLSSELGPMPLEFLDAFISSLVVK